MDPLVRHKISRTALRNHCKKLEGDIDALLLAFPPNGIVKLKTLKLAYEGQKVKVDAASEEVAKLIVSEDDLLKDFEDCMQHDEVFYSTISKINEKLGSSHDTKPDVKPNETTVTPSPTSGPKPPKIGLKHFDGDIMYWQTWWDQFDSAVHQKTTFSDVDKFTYLMTLLDGSAADCIAGLKLTSDNYKEAVELLQARFGNTQLLINAYAESFDALQPIQSMDQVVELRSMYDHVEATVRNLKSLIMEATAYGAFLVPLLSRRLPQENQKDHVT